MKALRDEFEPLLISPRGIHPTFELCKAAWDEYRIIEDGCSLDEQIRRAHTWLSRADRTQGINKRAGTSSRLKHLVESWFSARQERDVSVSNGSFLMAAHRLGFKIEPSHIRHASGLIIRDGLNAYINISQQSIMNSCRETYPETPEAPR